MTFSWAHTKQQAIEIKIAYAKTQAKAQHPDYKIKHMAECQDANKGIYTVLIKRITDETIKNQKRNETFQRKLHEDG